MNVDRPAEQMLDARDHKTWPFELSQAIGKEHRSIGKANSCDHKPTYKAEIDDATARMVAGYKRWLELKASLSAEEMNRCQRYWNATRRDKTWALSSDLMTREVAGQWVLCPRWASVLDEVRKMREVLA